MTSPATAAQLLAQAHTQVEQLHHQSMIDPPDPPDPQALAAAWPRYQHAGQRLMAALSGDQRHNEPPAPAPPRGEPGAEPQLSRAADLVAAAADLVTTRDRSDLPGHERARDVAFTGHQLAAAARLVVVTTVSDPALLPTLSAAAASACTWTRLADTAAAADLAQTSAPVSAASLTDATTGLSLPQHTDPPALAVAALQRWERAAVDAAQQPAPAGEDLLLSARAAGWLLGLSHRLLNAHSTTGGASDDAAPERTLTATIDQVRIAGHAWNAAARVWTSTATGGPVSPQLPRATRDLEQALQPLLSSPDTSSWQHATTLLAGVLTAVQTVADSHASLVERLNGTGALYAQARTLPVTLGLNGDEPQARIEARLNGSWVPLELEQARQRAAPYAQLPQLTAHARLIHADLDSPSRAALAAQPTPVPARPAPSPAPDRTPEPGRGPAARTVPGERWAGAIAAVDPRLLHDAHYPALAAALDRVDLTGADAPASLRTAAATAPLPEQHPARTLHSRLIDVCPSATIPFTRPANEPQLPPARTLPDATRPPSPSPSAPRR